MTVQPMTVQLMQPASVKVLGESKSGVKVVERDGVAVKTFPATAARVAQHEFRLLSTLHHPNVIKVFALLTLDDGTVEMQMEHGGSALFELLVEDKVHDPEGDFVQIVQGVRHMHEHGIAHLDLKLDNVVKRGSALRIIDVGLSVSVPASMRGTRCMQHMLGTRDYVAPEIWRQEMYDPFLADMWSLGVMAYAMHHKHMLLHAAHEKDGAFRQFAAAQAEGATPSAATRHVQEWRTQKTPPSLPQWLEATLDDALWVDPDKRYRMV